MNGASYLDAYLEPLADHLGRPEVTDIYINGPGELWTESLGGQIERHAAGAVDEALMMRLARQIANLSHQGISREHPLLAATLPDRSRVQIVAAPATRGFTALAIRKHVTSDLALKDYDEQGFFETTGDGVERGNPDPDLEQLYEGRLWSEFLRLAVRRRKTILIAGGTATGKTTFLNALMREIPAAERLILIEDTPELQLRHANMVGLVAVRGELGAAKVTSDDLLIASLRMRPDRIILGELRGSEAFTFLKAINTGHPGSLSTIHADSPSRALEQLSLMALQSGVQISRNDVLQYLATTIDVIVQLDRRNGRRRISQISWPNRRLS